MIHLLGCANVKKCDIKLFFPKLLLPGTSIEWFKNSICNVEPYKWLF